MPRFFAVGSQCSLVHFVVAAASPTVVFLFEIVADTNDDAVSIRVGFCWVGVGNQGPMPRFAQIVPGACRNHQRVQALPVGWRVSVLNPAPRLFRLITGAGGERCCRCVLVTPSALSDRASVITGPQAGRRSYRLSVQNHKRVGLTRGIGASVVSVEHAACSCDQHPQAIWISGGRW